MDRPAALITGASAGLGAEFAHALDRRGYALLLVARRRDRLAELAGRLAAAQVLEADLAADEGCARVEAAILAEPRLELLINNAGFGTRGYFAEIDLASQDRMHRLHVLATLRLTHAALRGFTARNRGGVINVASVAGFWQSPHNVSYCATKTWMNSFTEGLSYELAARGSAVKVQALCPGFTRTEFHDVLGAGRGGVPASWWMSAEDVVAASLRGLERGELFVVPGLRYKLLAPVMRNLPRWLKRRVATRTSRAFRER
jgi:short-subunit dehydrogenase